ncbi:uncharacterized protein LOC117607476 isoform X1 [Osmia lignaria lignaria]|uniref:uncharacterized protein LOC117607476 isoform X1 n=2 Tax=Osmia lignaria lignaria TaxID=1437193 RepID=UPI0014786312|nr:uncharacterized protein LOC117607476 isoform X1 [Osmia lignaria]XP_034187104.1 uncharacterized protein LOC117607476 isoform X1 [Osmia lignaria]
MEQKWQSPIITKSETVLNTSFLTATGQRLTPTGKISHAKTRVYTQRYRKEWEQMPDFKGWLTSVPFQPTRAYCLYCKKNLHAHRLSLLKHTCTMKHQRAALLHEAEEKKKAAARNASMGEDVEVEEVDEIEAVEYAKTEIEENEDEVEYVVERLETDDELDETQIKDPNEDVGGKIEEEEEEEEEEEVTHIQVPSDEEDVKHSMKKIKIERVKQCEDSLTEAMDHMQSEYLEEADNQDTVQLEMVVESEDQSNPEMEVMSILPDTEDSTKEESLKESRENERAVRRGDNKLDKKTGKLLQDECKQHGDSGIVMACPLPILGTTYQINTSTAPTSNTIGVLQPMNTIPIAPAQNKTITLTSGGKTLTLTGGTFQPGTQYVLSKLKNKLPTLIMADKKPTIAANQVEDATKGVQINKDQMAVASTSYQNVKKHVLLKNFKSPLIKKPRISTHVMDTSKGLPVGGLQVSLYKLMDGRWTFLNESNTSPNGRCVDLVDNMKHFTAGRYKIHFDVDKYFTLRRIETMYPFIEIVFDVKNPAGHYHIPVLLSPFGYTTYRGSER